MAKTVQELVEAGLSQREVARQLGVERDAVRWWLKRHPEVGSAPGVSKLSQSRQAIELMRSRGLSVAQASRETGVTESSIRATLSYYPELREGLLIRPKAPSKEIKKKAHKAIRLMQQGQGIVDAARAVGLNYNTLGRFLNGHPELAKRVARAPKRDSHQPEPSLVEKAVALVCNGQSCHAAARITGLKPSWFWRYLKRNPESIAGTTLKNGRPLLPRERMQEAIERIRAGATWEDAARVSGLTRHQIAYFIKTHPGIATVERMADAPQEEEEGRLPEIVRIRMAITGMCGGANAQSAAHLVGVEVQAVWQHLVRNPQVFRKLITGGVRGLPKVSGPIPRLERAEVAGFKTKVLEALAKSNQGLRLGEVMDAIDYPLRVAGVKATADHFRRQVMAPLVKSGELVIVGARRAARYRAKAS